MAYSTNPNLPKARAIALKMLIKEGLPLFVVANRCGVSRSTVWRWRRKWEQLNEHVQFTNLNRPSRPVSFANKLLSCKWRVETLSSAPRSHPARISEWVVKRILATRAALNRCAVIIREHLRLEGILVSVSTIRRVIAKYGLQKTKRRKIRRTLPRPDVNAPGDLVQMDTVHYVNKLTGERRYIFTVIDLYSRMAFARCFDRLLPGGALKTLKQAEDYFDFRIKVIQTDNGPEFSKWFTHMAESGTVEGGRRIHRRTRIHRPNDNAHIERFNRTLREECIGKHMSCNDSLEDINWDLLCFLDYYNEERLHLGLQCRTPRSMLQR